MCVAGVAVPDDAQAKIILKVATQSSRPGTPRADYLVHFENTCDCHFKRSTRLMCFCKRIHYTLE